MTPDFQHPPQLFSQDLDGCGLGTAGTEPMTNVRTGACISEEVSSEDMGDNLIILEEENKDGSSGGGDQASPDFSQHEQTRYQEASD